MSCNPSVPLWGATGETGCFTERPGEKKGRGRAPCLTEGKQPEFKVIWETPTERATLIHTSTPSFNQHLLGACCIADHKQLRKMKDTTDTG